MNKIVASLIVIGSALAQSNLGFSQTTKEVADLRREIQALKAGQTAIQKDLLEIKNMLLQREIQALREGAQGRPAAPAQGQAPAAAPTQVAMISVADALFKGEKSATLTLVDFTDYQ
jgi:hypothetical protein